MRERTRGQRLRKSERRILKRLFLEQVALSGCVTETCQALHIARNTLYNWLAHDTSFNAHYQAIRAARLQSAQAELERRYPEPSIDWMRVSEGTLIRAFNRSERRFNAHSPFWARRSLDTYLST